MAEAEEETAAKAGSKVTGSPFPWLASLTVLAFASAGLAAAVACLASIWLVTSGWPYPCERLLPAKQETKPDGPRQDRGETQRGASPSGA